MSVSGGSYSGFGAPGSDDTHHHTWLYVILAVILALVAFGVLWLVLAPPGTMRPTMMGFSWWWPVGLFWGILWLLIIVWIISWVVRGIWWTGMGYSRRYHRRWADRWGDDDSAMGIARERYARGELTREQFDQLMRDLESHRGRP